jgi:F-type H+-transporting ATPase subunit alpha
MAAFAQFGSDLDKATQNKLAQGERLLEALKQPQYSPYNLEDQIAILFLAINGYLLNVETDDVSAFIKEYLTFLKNEKCELVKNIAETGVLSVEQETELHEAIHSFKGNG